jgi:hypothetical protein
MFVKDNQGIHTTSLRLTWFTRLLYFFNNTVSVSQPFTCNFYIRTHFRSLRFRHCRT